MSLLEPGRTCWRKARAKRVSVLIDAAAYYAAFRQAALAAQRSLFIVGWDVDTRTRLVPDDEPEDGYPPALLDFLNALLDATPGLEIYVLCWDFSVIYALEREPLAGYKFAWRGHRRLHFALDAQHPAGASHHQKLAVIDDRVAFAGGVDLTIRRWDTPAHRAEDPRRRDPGGAGYAPVHDVQLAVDGEAAAALGELARQRWRRATGERAPAAPGWRPSRLGRWSPVAGEPLDPWPALAVPDFREVEVGIARTGAAFAAQPEPIHEVLRLTLAAIGAARCSILIENQYLTSARIGEALAGRLREPDGPEVVAILPRVECGWLERSSLGVLRTNMLARLRAEDRHGRLHVYYPSVPDIGEHSVNVHSKLLIVDDRLLKVGSSNLSNRSMGLDTECDLVIAPSDAEPGAAAVRAGIAAVEWRLLGEHLDQAPEAVAAAVASHGSIAAAIETRRGAARSLQPLVDEQAAPLDLTMLDGLFADPERPMEPSAFLAQIVPHELHRPARKSLLLVAAAVTLLLLTAVLFHFAPLSQIALADRLAAAHDFVRDSAAGPWVVVLCYALCGLAFVPVTLLIAGTALAFGAWQALLYAMLGSLSSASLCYGLGRALHPLPLRYLRGARMMKLRVQLRRRGFRGVIAARLVPVGNFTAVNLLAGALRVPFRTFMLANFFGLLPGVLVLTLLADRLKHGLREPTALNLALLLLAATATGFCVQWLRRAFRRSAPASSALSEAAHGGPAE